MLKILSAYWRMRLNAGRERPSRHRDPCPHRKNLFFTGSPPPDPLPMRDRGTDLTTAVTAALLAGLTDVLWTSPTEGCSRPPTGVGTPAASSSKLDRAGACGTQRRRQKSLYALTTQMTRGGAGGRGGGGRAI